MDKTLLWKRKRLAIAVLSSLSIFTSSQVIATTTK